jgi:lipoate-protein ligase A
MEFNFWLEQRYSWGNIDLKFVVASGQITSCAAYSDALETEYFEKLSKALTGCKFSSAVMAAAVEEVAIAQENTVIRQDIISLLEEAKL